MSKRRFNNFTFQAPIPPAPLNWSWEGLMAEALKEADKAYLEGEVPVGALIVNKRGEIISKAHNKTIQNKDPCAHAEILTIRNACSFLSNTHLSEYVLVVTLEPCLMCAAAITLARLNGVVFGAWDEIAGAISSTNDFFNFPTNSKPTWYIGGISANPCVKILHNFFLSRRI